MTLLPLNSDVAANDLRTAHQLYYDALDLLADGHPADAAALLRTALALDGGFLDGWHALTRALQDAGELDEAVAAVQRLIALDPEDVLAHTRLSILYQARGMVAEAEQEATRAKLLGWKQQLRQTKAEKSAGELA